MGTPGQERTVAVNDVATQLRVSTRSVWRLLAHGHLERVKVGRATRIPVDSVTRFIQAGGTR